MSPSASLRLLVLVPELGLHFALITKLNYLARCLKKLGQVDESVQCYTRSAAILRQLRESPEAAAAQGDAVGMLG